MKGRKPLPKKILQLIHSQNAPKRRDEPEPQEGIPDMPDYLDEKAKAVWVEVTKALDEMQILTKTDRNAIIRYCAGMAIWKQTYERLLFLPDDEGLRRYFKSLMEILLKYEQDFGLTASSRGRLHVTKSKKKDNLEEFLHG